MQLAAGVPACCSSWRTRMQQRISLYLLRVLLTPLVVLTRLLLRWLALLALLLVPLLTMLLRREVRSQALALSCDTRLCLAAAMGRTDALPSWPVAPRASDSMTSPARVTLLMEGWPPAGCI